MDTTLNCIGGHLLPLLIRGSQRRRACNSDAQARVVLGRGFDIITRTASGLGLWCPLSPIQNLGYEIRPQMPLEVRALRLLSQYWRTRSSRHLELSSETSEETASLSTPCLPHHLVTRSTSALHNAAQY
jgi:hypothetical protein